MVALLIQTGRLVWWPKQTEAVHMAFQSLTTTLGVPLMVDELHLGKRECVAFSHQHLI